MGDAPGTQHGPGHHASRPPPLKADDDPFAPLPEEAEQPQQDPEVWEPRPAPDVLPQPADHKWPGYGKGVRQWVYLDEAGVVLHLVVRFERPREDGRVEKTTIPFTYGYREWTSKAGKPMKRLGWHAKSMPPPRPLYGLDRLAARYDAPVLLVEGEKSADAATDLFPAYVAVCSSGGSNATSKADWSPLAGRAVTIWRDNDVPGAKFAREVKTALKEVSAGPVAAVEIPTDWPDGWDVADELPPDVTVDDLAAMITAAETAGDDPAEAAAEWREAEIERLSELPAMEYQILRKDAAQTLNIGVTTLDKLVKAVRARRAAERAVEFRARPGPGPGETQWPYGFRMKQDGLYVEGAGDDAPDVWICPPFRVLGQGRDAQGVGWGIWLEWSDPDGRVHRWAMPSRLVMVGPGELEGELVDRGLQVSADPAARTHLRRALSEVKSGSRVITVDQPGWHDAGGGGSAYVLPNGDLIGPTNESVVLRSIPDAAPLMTAQAGDLDGWREQIAAKAVGNSVAAFCISMAFASTIADMLGEPSGGFHLFGRSKIGKTLVAAMAVSVFGSPRKGGVLRDWRSTSNGMELAASDSNDGLLVLDEIHQAEPRELVQAVYMLANESGKGRARRDLNSAKKKTWKTLILSTGEIDVASMAAKAGQHLPAGAQVRLPSLPVDPGMWSNLHGHDDIRALLADLHSSMRRQHGTAGRAFLERLAAERADAMDDLLDGMEEMRDRFRRLIPRADGQVLDVARRCALVAFAGRLACEWGILPWHPDEAFAAAKAMLTIWIKQRGGQGTTEESQHLRLIRLFLVKDGAARFVRIHKNFTDNKWEITHPDRPVINRAGWVTKTSDDRDEYLIDPDVWKNVCTDAQAESTEVALTLKNAGHLATSPSERHLAMKRRIPGLGLTRVFVIQPSLLGNEEEEGTVPTVPTGWDEFGNS